MATANKRTGPRRGLGGTVLLALAVLAVTLGWFYSAPIAGYASTGAAFGARTACSCRYLAGRDLNDCQKDFEPGMGVVFLSDDPDAKSVTAWVPLLASDTARYVDGYGCVLDRWRGQETQDAA